MQEALNLFASCFFAPGKFPEGIRSFCLPALTGAADAFLTLTMASARRKCVLVVTPGIPVAERLVDDVRLLTDGESCRDTRVLEYPQPLAGDKTSLGLRLKTLAALRAWRIKPYPCIVVAPIASLNCPVSGNATSVTLSPGNSPHLADLAEKLAAYGYERLSQVEKEGDFSIRGGILDLWSPGDEFPIRAEFFGDELESIRTFSSATQTSIATLDACEILPIRESQADGPDGGQRPETLLDCLPNDAAIIALDHNAYSLQKRAFDFSPLIFSGDPPPQGIPSYSFLTASLPGFAELGADEAHHPELFEAARRRLDQHLSAAKARGTPVFSIDDLSSGFEIPGMIVTTKADRTFSRRRNRILRALRKNSQGARLSDFDELEPGEYVVHVDYGVGRYIGSSEIALDDKRKEVFTIEYADGARLHVPATHAHLLSRYVGVKGEAVRLHRLDGKRWEKDKKDAQKAITDLAAALLETQAKREMVPGFAYDIGCDGLEAFEAAFPYEETPDQLSAIEAVKKDLSSKKPMDRLICGDAGYGKTEVAMRAAFIAAMNGRQVAVLAPTTVLAEQHFETFTARFDGTPVRIESCSRFQTAGTHDGTFRRLATGVCDIVIGTHAILSPKIRFRDLGLIIIDEEQRFGVRHKEFLKRLRATADVLTLSATPIPRTLYLSMTGARDLSLLRSPPRERVAVETRIVRDSDETIRTAVELELARGGQVFFLHNRVMDISRVEKRLRDILSRMSPPRIVVAHGQMDARSLAVIMRDFERGKYDVLLATTIIESGIDIPRANTIIIDQADTFGMADLYQLRGRVGRSSRQGYAYFLLPPSGIIDAEARERLDALQRHGGLGSGYNLAVRDLELRGAGNLLGSQQSGHIAAIGFGLYCQLLQRTVSMMKGERVKAVVDVKLNLDFADPRIPYEYIEEDVQRFSLMKRFAEAQDIRVVKALAAEMKDRFGPLPPEVREFVRIAELRVTCAAAGFEHVDVKETRAVFYKTGSRDIDFVMALGGKTPKAKLDELVRTMRSRLT